MWIEKGKPTKVRVTKHEELFLEDMTNMFDDLSTKGGKFESSTLMSNDRGTRVGSDLTKNKQKKEAEDDPRCKSGKADTGG